MIWYRITLCVVFCLLQLTPSESRPSSEPTETSDVPETHGHNEDDYTSVLVKAEMVFHMYGNGTVTKSDSTQMTTIFLEGDEEKAFTGGNSTYTVIQTDEMNGDAVGDKESNDSTTIVHFTAFIEAEIPKNDNVTATADTIVTFVSQGVNQTDTSSSAASINGGIIDNENTDEITTKLEDSIVKGDQIVLSDDGSSMILHMILQLNSNNETTTIETDLTSTAVVTMNDGDVEMTTDSTTNTVVKSNEDSSDQTGETIGNQSGGESQGQDKATGEAAVKDGSVEDTPGGAIVRTSNQAITIVRTNNGDKEAEDIEPEIPCETGTE